MFQLQRDIEEGLLALYLGRVQAKLGLFLGNMFILALLAGSSCSLKNSPAPQSVSGTIETDEVHVASRYGGRVEKILARDGDALTNGQVIVELEAAELKARHDQTAAELAELEAGPRKEEKETARHDWEAQVAELEKAQNDAKRAEELFAQKTISPTEREQAVTRARTLEKNVAAAKSRYDLLLAGTRPERLAQARAAPSDCVLEVLEVKPVDVLAPNRELATLLLPQHLWVRVYVPEPWLGHIKLGDTVKVRVDSDPGRDFHGVVEQIAREAEFTPRNVQTVGERIKQVFGVKVRLDGREDKLRAGMSADVIFPKVPN